MYLPSHNDQRSLFEITMGWLVLAVCHEDVMRSLVVNTFKLNH